MSRARRGFKARRRRNKVRKIAKGFHFSRRQKYALTVETVIRSLHYRYIGRRLLKRDMRRLWIVRISAAAKNLETSYSKLVGALKSKGIELNRKMLSELAARDFEAFKAVVNSVK